jgi:serine/threonine-protein kinase
MKSSSQSDPWIGRLVGDRQRYRLDKRLAAGGMGDVFVAVDTLLGKQVALKLLKDTLVASGELRKRFEREVALCAALRSDHIVEVSDYGVTVEGYPFFVMEYLRGQSLGELLRQKKRLPVERTVGIISQVCDGLSLAHGGVTLWRNNATVSEQIKVVHRDLKPDNIFLVSTVLGELVKILDFGVAKIRETQAEHTSLTNMFLGTFHYAAPEQLEVEKDLDGRADIYSLGIIVYEMLSGTDPFGLGLNTRKISEISWALAHTSKPVVPLRSQPGLAQISLELEAAVTRCLQKAPDKRFASVDELKRALQAAVVAVGGETIAQLPTPAAQNEDKTVPRPLAPPKPEIPDATIVRPLASPKPEIPETTITQFPADSTQGGDNSSVNRSLTPLRQEVADVTIPSLEPDSLLAPDALLEILIEIVGPIAPILLQQVSAQASSTKELVGKLALYLSPKQQIEFEKRTTSLLEKSLDQLQSSSLNSPNLKNQAINPSFLDKCEQYLSDVVGPVATLLIQEALKSHPQISSAELVNILAAKIPDRKKADNFSRRLLK